MTNKENNKGIKSFLITILIIIAINISFALIIVPPIHSICKIIGYEIQLQECIELAFYLDGILMSVYCLFLILNILKRYNL